jgi:hypothetical protein
MPLSRTILRCPKCERPILQYHGVTLTADGRLAHNNCVRPYS